MLGIAALIFIMGCVVGCEGNKYFSPCREMPTSSVTTQMVVKRDTVKVEVPAPVSKGVVKTEIVKPRKTDDVVESNTEVPTYENDAPTITQSGEVEIPIERKTYQGEDFKAVVEGWRPNLVSMEVYPKTTTITKTEVKLKKPVFSVTVGPGAGWDGKEIKPYLGVTAGLVIFSK